MIVGVFDGPYKTGDVVQGTYTRNIGEYYHARFYVLKDATRDEWLQYRTENGLDIIPGYLMEHARFYRVSTD